MQADQEQDWRPEELATLQVGRLARMLTKLSDDRLKALGVSAAQLPVLVALKNGEALTQKELAEDAGVEQPSMAQLLARMEKGGLIRREPAPKDRRSSLIQLTDHALRQLEPGRAALRGIDAEVCVSLSAAEQETLVKLLVRMIANAGAALGDPRA